jgi:hypothetical protein
VTASRPIDTTTSVTIDGKSSPVSSALELTRLIEDSQLFQSCLVRHYFRFAQARVESPANDGCLLSAMETAARGGEPIAQVLKLLATDTTFKNRRFK